MENLFIEGTDTLPMVELDTTGKMKFEGRALPENAARFFTPIKEWATEYSGNKLLIDVNLEYFNTSVSKQLHDFFKILHKKSASCKVTLTWHYEEGDDEMLESGEIYEELFPDFDFNYNKYEEIFD